MEKKPSNSFTVMLNKGGKDKVAISAEAKYFGTILYMKNIKKDYFKFFPLLIDCVP